MGEKKIFIGKLAFVFQKFCVSNNLLGVAEKIL